MTSEREAYLQKQAWDYFALHAQQRLTTLNFYLVLATALSAAIVASYQKDFQFPRLRFLAGLLLSLLSYVFWRLDLRNRELIKNAEAALRSFELEHQVDDWTADLPREYLFSREHRAEKRRTRQGEEEEEKRGWSLLLPRSYSQAFELLFLVFFFLGVIGAVSVAS